MKGMTCRNDKTGEATVEHTCDARAVFDKLAIIVVTYKRQQLLEELLASFAQLTVAPWRIVIVDNEHSDETQDMVDEFREKADGLWGTTDADRKGGTSRVVYAPQTDNLGGAGGFSVGVKVAYDLGAEWFWVMDDDVAVLPDGIEKLAKWGRDHDVIQGGKLDFDGGPFYWQYNFIVPLGIPNPIAPAAFGSAGYRVMNTLCFEGGLFRRRIVEKIGLPDPRFFIYWDDTMYGYLASKVTNSIVVPDVVMRRARHQQLGHRRIAAAELHLGHEPVPHPAQPRVHGPVLHGARRLPASAVRPGNGRHGGERGYSPGRGRPRARAHRAGADRQGMAGLAQADARPEVAADAAVGAAIASGTLSKLADTSTFCVYSCCICEF